MTKLTSTKRKKLSVRYGVSSEYRIDRFVPRVKELQRCVVPRSSIVSPFATPADLARKRCRILRKEKAALQRREVEPKAGVAVVADRYSAVAKVLEVIPGCSAIPWHDRLKIETRFRLAFERKEELTYGERGKSVAPEVISDQDRLCHELESLGNLSDGWDGDDAPAPSPASTSAMGKILPALHSNGLTCKTLRATVDGGVALDFEAGKSYADVECTNEGEILWVIKEFGKPSVAWESDLSEEGLGSSIRRVVTFLGKL